MGRRRLGQKGIWKGIISFLGLVLAWLLRVIPLGLSLALVIFIFLGVRKMLYADPYFRVNKIAVVPSGVLTQGEYRYLEQEAAAKSILRVDLKQISKNLERNPKVKRADVMRVLPNQLKVFLATRTAVFQVRFQSSGAYYLIGNDQMVLGSKSAPEPDLVILEDFSAKKKAYTFGTLFQNRYFDRIVEIMEWIKSDPLLGSESTSKLVVDQLGNVSMILNDGIELKVGKEPNLSEAKRALLKKLLRSPERDSLVYLDLRYHDVVVKKK